MSAIFCCSSISPYRPRQLDHEAKFRIFMRWASLQTTSLVPVDGSLVGRAPYAIQIVRQINYGPQESIRYFVPASNGSDFAEATEDDLLKSNFDKLNSYLIMKSPWVTDPVLTVKPCRYKNFRCEKHNKFFEINLYQKNPANKHHWRVNLARPSRDIDLAFRRKDPEAESGNKAEESAGQEERQELLSSDIQGKSSFPELRISLSQTLEEADEIVVQKIQSADQPDIATLKTVLRFLLPTVGIALGGSRLLTLLSLDWANAELDLGLEFENLWKAELTSSNIVNFFCEYLTSYANAPLSVQVDLREVEGLVIPAMRLVESRNGQQLAGQVKFHEIVNRVLESGCTLDWVSMYRGSIVRVFASGPGELLDRHQRRSDRFQQDRSNRHAEEAHDTQTEEVGEEFKPWMHRGEYDDCDPDSDDHELMKDFTACDK
ncbi:hypothetical protein MMC14_009967, partial [Varicellaria rhodocarpa]|nr:hypothetical protein [Varicellaria rhodocarpa]